MQELRALLVHDKRRGVSRVERRRLLQHVGVIGRTGHEAVDQDQIGRRAITHHGQVFVVQDRLRQIIGKTLRHRADEGRATGQAKACGQEEREM